VTVLVLVVDDEPDVEGLASVVFRRDLRVKRFAMDLRLQRLMRWRALPLQSNSR
jgi:hypothetical protein